ncbi:Protein argonaute 5 [Frankliniella fusca]|uniref:Protein argonaute 5 n=1 Tax=Frankliniella fusca TaxID=407009 RepID=A0AAE1I1W6_9NEOP|nr:Protein argonaute 5 [Frankliniella fusca]
MESYPNITSLSDQTLRTITTLTDEEVAQLLGWDVTDSAKASQLSSLPNVDVEVKSQIQPTGMFLTDKSEKAEEVYT